MRGLVVSQLMVTFELPRQAAQPHRCTTTTNGSHQRQLAPAITLNLSVCTRGTLSNLSWFEDFAGPDPE